ncbi:hypothetical protein FCI58_11585 [Enterobacter hormaechei]|nr:hypothetical protein [Enterobacter hormaechei]
MKPLLSVNGLMMRFGGLLAVNNVNLDHDVLPHLFEVRASHLLGNLPREQVSEFLSGLLIGAEVASMRDFIAHEQAITIVAGASLTSRYEQAFRAVGRDVLTISGDTAFQAGIRSIAHAVAN